MKKLLLLLPIFLIFSSCANIFNGVVLPDRCKRCEVIDLNYNTMLWEVEGCGSSNTRLEEKAKVEAYDMSRNGYNLCDLEVRCEEWTMNEDDEIE